MLLLSSCMAAEYQDSYLSEPEYSIICGMVTDMDGNPLERIRITLEANDGNREKTYYTASDGSFRCEFRLSEGLEEIVMGITIEDIDKESNGGYFETKSDSIIINRKDYKESPIVIEIPVYRLNHANASESIPQS